MSGLAHDEMKPGAGGLVYRMMDRLDFVVPPLPNLLFTRDSSAWVGDRVAVTSLAMPARGPGDHPHRAIYRYHPRFAGTELLYDPALEHLEGGDVLLLAPGVLAVGVGERTTAAGAERLARRVLRAGLAHTVLAVPIAQERATMHLDTVCTMVDVDAVVMYPNVADTLQALTVTARAGRRARGGRAPPVPDRGRRGDGYRPVAHHRHRPRPGHRRTRTVGRRQQHPRLAPRLCVAYERNVETNAALERAGIEVIAISGSELGWGRGGPRCMSCPIERAPL